MDGLVPDRADPLVVRMQSWCGTFLEEMFQVFVSLIHSVKQLHVAKVQNQSSQSHCPQYKPINR